MSVMNMRLRIALCAALLAATGVAAAQSKQGSTQGAFYRCKDASGKPIVASSMPPECRGRDTEVLNSSGTVIETIDSDVTRERKAAQAAEEERQLKERNEQMQRDRVLLETYLSVTDIERLRDQRLELLQAQYRVAEQHIATLHERLNQLRQQSARFKPYSEAPNAPPLPEHLAEALMNTVRSIEVDRATLETNKKEQAELSAKFERDIKRFRELKALQPR